MSGKPLTSGTHRSTSAPKATSSSHSPADRQQRDALTTAQSKRGGPPLRGRRGYDAETMIHQLDDALENLHGHLSRRLPPRLRIASEDTVVYKTCNAGWNDRPPHLEPGESLGRRPEGAGHALSGPI